MVEIYFTTNDEWYSKLHRKIEGVPATHIGIGFFIGSMNMIVDCTKPHGKVYHRDHWLSRYTLVKTLRFDMPVIEEKKCFVETSEYSVMAPYDWGAYAYAWIMGVRKYLFKTPYKETNPWSSEKGKWCTEILNPILPYFRERGITVLDGLDLAAHTPWMVYLLLKDKLEELPVDITN